MNSKFLYSFLLSKQTNPERARRIKRLKVGQKILYILVVLILVLTLIWQVYSCMENYAAEPTYTETKVVKQQKAEFPAFTFCVEGSSYKVDVLQVKLCIMYYEKETRKNGREKGLCGNMKSKKQQKDDLTWRRGPCGCSSVTRGRPCRPPPVPPCLSAGSA